MIKEKELKTKKTKIASKKTASKKITPKKTVSKKAVSEKKKVVSSKKISPYFEGVGRRKTSVARVRINTQEKIEFLVNGKSSKDYFPNFDLQEIIMSPLEKLNCIKQFNVSVKIVGGGFHSQAEAVRHGLSKALILFDLEFRKKLKKEGFLTRDSRMRERKKFGLKRARRAAQWSKR